MKLQVTVTEETLLRITELLLDRDAWELCALEVATQTVRARGDERLKGRPLQVI